MDKKALIEAIKEIVRNTVMAIIPVVLSGINTETGTFSINLKVIMAVALYTLITGIDRYLHQAGKDRASKVERGESFGLVRL